MGLMCTGKLNRSVLTMAELSLRPRLHVRTMTMPTETVNKIIDPLTKVSRFNGILEFQRTRDTSVEAVLAVMGRHEMNLHSLHTRQSYCIKDTLYNSIGVFYKLYRSISRSSKFRPQLNLITIFIPNN